MKNTWRFAPVPSEKPEEGFVPPPETWKNYYHRLFKNSVDAAVYSLNNFDRLYADTKEFKELLFSTSMPSEAIEAVSANLSTLKSPACLRLENGEMYFFEGCNCTFGSCEGSCTHVLNYAYSLPFLFPKLERTLRDVEYTYNYRESGSMTFRVNVPLGNPRWYFRACVDGQFGTIIKVYREWKISGDDKWLEGLWEKVKGSLEFAWSPENTDKWDYDKDGVLEGSQHHTLDMELFGPNAWLTGYYLAALKAASEMARYLGDNEKAKEYSELFNKGRSWVEENLFNGEYYIQQIDVTDKNILMNFPGSRTILGEPFEKSYWNEESGEIKYQLGDGCMIDQLSSQWHANNCGLGEIFEAEHVKKTLSSIYCYNFKKTMRDFVNPCRVYCLYDEAGTVVCQWPHGNKPDVPAPYSQETFNGMEYQAACLMIQNGLEEQGMELVKAVRDRYDGEKRNPWNEFESGSNYVRSMASYALLLAYSGFEYHVPKGMIGFDPVWDGKFFQSFWSLDSGYGLMACTPYGMEISITRGFLALNKVNSNIWSNKNVLSVTSDNQQLNFTQNGRELSLTSTITLRKDEKLIIRY